MATPTVQTTSTGYTTGTSHVLTMPAGIAAGDLLIAFFSSSGPSTQTYSGSWAELYDMATGATLAGVGVWLTAAGGDTLTVTSSISVDAMHVIYRISGQHASSAPEAGTSATGNSANPDPPTLSPSWGSETTLWLAAMHHDAGTISVIPTNYTDSIKKDDAGSPIIGTARRALTAASDDPGTFTVSAIEAWVAQTVAVRPAAGGSTALTGTATASITETDIRAGGKTIILTLTGDTFVVAGTGPIGSTANTTALIYGIDSAQSGVVGWDALVKPALIANQNTRVVRTSATVCTITLPAVGGYDVQAQETITATIPAEALSDAVPIVATPTFTVSTVTEQILWVQSVM